MKGLRHHVRRIVSDKIEVPTWLFAGLSVSALFNAIYGLLR